MFRHFMSCCTFKSRDVEKLAQKLSRKAFDWLFAFCCTFADFSRVYLNFRLFAFSGFLFCRAKSLSYATFRFSAFRVPFGILRLSAPSATRKHSQVRASKKCSMFVLGWLHRLGICPVIAFCFLRLRGDGFICKNDLAAQLQIGGEHSVNRARHPFGPGGALEKWT